MDKDFTTKFLGYWVANTIVLSLANTFFPDYFELGTASLSAPMAAVFSAFLITSLLFMAKGLSRKKMFKMEGRYIMFAYYWLSAFAAVWLVARIADVSGFGVASFVWAVALGFVVSLANWAVRQTYKGMKMV